MWKKDPGSEGMIQTRKFIISESSGALLTGFKVINTTPGEQKKNHVFGYFFSVSKIVFHFQLKKIVFELFFFWFCSSASSSLRESCTYLICIMRKKRQVCPVYMYVAVLCTVHGILAWHMYIVHKIGYESRIISGQSQFCYFQHPEIYITFVTFVL